MNEFENENKKVRMPEISSSQKQKEVYVLPDSDDDE